MWKLFFYWACPLGLAFAVPKGSGFPLYLAVLAEQRGCRCNPSRDLAYEDNFSFN